MAKRGGPGRGQDKQCSRCGDWKPLESFHSDGKGGKRANCSSCKNADNAVWNAGQKAETRKLIADGQSQLTAELGADFDNTEERHLREMIAMLHESYTKAAKPYLDRLASIYALRPPPRMFVTKEMYEAKNG